MGVSRHQGDNTCQGSSNSSLSICALVTAPLSKCVVASCNLDNIKGKSEIGDRQFLKLKFDTRRRNCTETKRVREMTKRERERQREMKRRRDMKRGRDGEREETK